MESSMLLYGSNRTNESMILIASSAFSFPISSSRRTSIAPPPHHLKPLSVGTQFSITEEDKKLCECFDFHKVLIPYGDAWKLQKEIVREKKALIERNEECPDTLIVLQHHPVYTLGTGSSIEYLNFDIRNAPFDIFRTERGGEVTYHGPGQIVMYPIMNLRNHKMDLHWYLRALEEVIIRVLSSTFTIKASRVEGLTGVWMGDQKLAAIGIKVSNWITYHGLALNVTTDLTPFDWIVPCGIKNRKVGSIKGLLTELQLSGECGGGRGVDVHHFDDDFKLIDMTSRSLMKEFSEMFQLNIHYKTPPILKLYIGKLAVAGLKKLCLLIIYFPFCLNIIIIGII